MDAYIDRIYELMHSPITTPYNLLENAKLDNYSYVKYYMNDQRFIAEMECCCDDGVMRKFYYEFDDNSLVAIYTDCGTGKEIIFEREYSLCEAMSDYHFDKYDQVTLTAI